mmetsp:Transcript_4674/g.19897  ORF Transcript_4674/g.19897 Transcript_4674/m.19897 type:complete len:202 (+) Transcript_4674:1340-1945(+)
MAPSMPWYTSPRAPSPPTYHQFFFSDVFASTASSLAAEMRPTSGNDPRFDLGGFARTPYRTTSTRQAPFSSASGGYAAEALATSSRAAAEARDAISRRELVTRSVGFGVGARGASSFSSSSMFPSGTSPARRASATDAPYSFVVPTSSRSGPSGAMYGDPRTPGASSGQHPTFSFPSEKTGTSSTTCPPCSCVGKTSPWSS